MKKFFVVIIIASFSFSVIHFSFDDNSVKSGGFIQLLSSLINLNNVTLYFSLNGIEQYHDEVQIAIKPSFEKGEIVFDKTNQPSGVMINNLTPLTFYYWRVLDNRTNPPTICVPSCRAFIILK